MLTVVRPPPASTAVPVPARAAAAAADQPESQPPQPLAKLPFPEPGFLADVPREMRRAPPSPAGVFDAFDARPLMQRSGPLVNSSKTPLGERLRLRFAALFNAADGGRTLQDSIDASGFFGAEAALQILLLNGHFTVLSSEWVSAADQPGCLVDESCERAEARVPAKSLLLSSDGLWLPEPLPYLQATRDVALIHFLARATAKVLDLRHLRIEDAHLFRLIASLENFAELKVINLSHNLLTTAGLAYLLAGLDKLGVSLVQLYVHGNALDESGERLLQAYNDRLLPPQNDFLPPIILGAPVYSLDIGEATLRHGAASEHRRVAWEYEAISFASHCLRHRATLGSYTRRLRQLAASSPVCLKAHAAHCLWVGENEGPVRRIEEMDLGNTVASLDSLLCCLALLAQMSRCLRHVDLSGNRLSDADLVDWTTHLRKSPDFLPELRSIDLRGRPYSWSVRQGFAQAAHDTYPNLLAVHFWQDMDEPPTNIFAQRDVELAEQASAYDPPQPDTKVPTTAVASALADECWRRNCFALRLRTLFSWERQICTIHTAMKTKSASPRVGVFLEDDRIDV